MLHSSGNRRWNRCTSASRPATPSANASSLRVLEAMESQREKIAATVHTRSSSVTRLQTRSDQLAVGRGRDRPWQGRAGQAQASLADNLRLLRETGQLDQGRCTG